MYPNPAPCRVKKRSLFRIAGAVVGMSQVESNGTIAVAFGSDRVDLFSSKDAFNMLKLLRTIDLNSPELKSLPQRSGNHQYVRSILLTKTELYICGMSENYGLLLLDFWEWYFLFLYLKFQRNTYTLLYDKYTKMISLILCIV